MNLSRRIIARLALLGAGGCLLASCAARQLDLVTSLVIALAIGIGIGALTWRGVGRPLHDLVRAARRRLPTTSPSEPSAWRGDWAGADAVGRDFEQELREASERENDLRTKLQAREERSSEFFANTVHELRTPLTTIIASLDMLQEGYATTPEEQTEIMEQATSASRHLMMLINDLLDTSAYESGKLHVDLQDCAVEELLQEAQHLLQPLAIARGVDLQIVVSESDLQITTDRSRILQILFNLVGNALKFSPSSSCVLLQALATPIGVAFEVVDEGPGVPSDARSRLFTKFGRLHVGSASGTGIGLYLSKILVEQMHGSIGFMERDPGPGAVFWFTLPSAKIEQPDATAAATP